MSWLIWLGCVAAQWVLEIWKRVGEKAYESLADWKVCFVSLTKMRWLDYSVQLPSQQEKKCLASDEYITRISGWKCKPSKFKQASRLGFVAVSVMNCWNKLPKKAIVYISKLNPFLENICQPSRNFWALCIGNGVMPVTEKVREDS